MGNLDKDIVTKALTNIKKQIQNQDIFLGKQFEDDIRVKALDYSLNLVKGSKNENNSKLMDLIDELEDASWNHQEYKIIEARNRLHKILNLD